MSKIKIVLVEDVQNFWKWSSVIWLTCCAAALEIGAWLAAHWATVGTPLSHLITALPADKWQAIGEMLQAMPSQDQAHTLAVTLMGGVAFRVTSIGRKPPANPVPTTPQEPGA